MIMIIMVGEMRLMMRISYVLIFLIWFNQLNSQNYVVDCGKLIPKDTEVRYDTLFQLCSTTLLVQDNVILTIDNLEVLDTLKISYGDIDGDTIDGVSYEIMNRTLNGVSYIDKRPIGDVNPLIIFNGLSSLPENVIIGDYVDYEVNSSLSVEDIFNGIDLMNVECDVYTMLGQPIYKGTYKDMFYKGIIREEFSNKMLVFVYHYNNLIYTVKRQYVKW